MNAHLPSFREATKHERESRVCLACDKPLTKGRGRWPVVCADAECRRTYHHLHYVFVVLPTRRETAKRSAF